MEKQESNAQFLSRGSLPEGQRKSAGSNPARSTFTSLARFERPKDVSGDFVPSL
jgi:hypothetical protein